MARDPNAQTPELAWIAPQKAISGDLPKSEGWAAELKWDGMRIGTLIDSAPAGSAGKPAATLYSSNGHNVTKCFPEFQELAPKLGVSAILDGEAVVFEGGRPSFNQLQQRIHVESPSQTLLAQYPVVYVIFDLLMLDGTPLLDLNYRQRRQLLEDLMPDGPQWNTPPYDEDGGERLLELCRQRNLEGVVVKKLDSLYRPGSRSADWIKVKIRLRQEFVVCGWIPGQNSLANQIGSLAIAVWADNPPKPRRLVFAGTVGSGLTDVERTRLAALLVDRDTPAVEDIPELAKQPVWTEPSTVVEVEYAEWPINGVLRHPVYAGVRGDTNPDDVEREIA